MTLQNFRNYSKKTFEFNPDSTLIVGPNAVGKTNILEAVYLLATGKSYRAENEHELIRESQQVSIITGEIIDKRYGITDETKENRNGETILEIDWDDRQRFTKTYKMNGVGKRQIDFIGNLRAVLFSPQDIEIATDSPSTRRRYLDSVLEQIFKDYRSAVKIYERAVRQRNRLLWLIREKGASKEQLPYWNNLIIENGRVIHERRKDFLNFLSDLGNLRLTYDHSIISEERLERYAKEEIGAAATLVGPHRDDFKIELRIMNHELREARRFGSRGQQRLAVFQIKLGELEYIKKATGEDPILLLDDIFSELDHQNRHHVLEVIPKQQTIMTTTDLHLVDQRALKSARILELS